MRGLQLARHFFRGHGFGSASTSFGGVTLGHPSDKQRYGLVTRLHSHANGRFSGDQFCVYVANRLVIPTLRAEQLALFATGELNLDRLTKAYIRERLAYRYAVVESSGEAYSLERQCREGLVFGAKPLLNPA